MLLFLPLFFYAQNNIRISGSITDSLSKPLASAIITIQTPEKKIYSITDFYGKFSNQLSTNLNKINLSIKLIGYIDKDTIINVDNRLNIFIAPIVLHTNIIQLSEVIVRNSPISQSGDTTRFFVSAFSKKTDDNLEDVLKKIPGFDISPSGVILYNNKSIENIFIDGDELAKNYKLISRNIPIDAIDKVEMIDKYQANPLLKDLTNSDKQVMNLTLKNPQRLKLFGSTKIGLGIHSKKNLAGSYFGVREKMKIMILANNNNIGISPYDEVSPELQYEQSRDYDFSPSLMPNHVKENSLFRRSIFTTTKNNLFNESRMGIVNQNFKINKSTNIKLFTDVYTDNIAQYETLNSINVLLPELSFSASSNKLFKPINFNNYVEFKSQTTRSQFLLIGTFNYKKYFEGNSINLKGVYSTGLISNFYRKGAGAFLTVKIDTNRVFEISSQLLSDKKNQDYYIKGDTFRILDSLYYTNIQQQVTNDRILNVKTELKYIYKTVRGRTNQFNFSHTFINSDLSGSLLLDTSSTVSVNPLNYQNYTNLLYNKFSAVYITDLKLNRIVLGVNLGGSLLNNSYLIKGYNAYQKQQYFFPVANIKLGFRMNPFIDVTYQVSYSADIPNLDMIAIRPILTSFRTMTSYSNIIGNIPKIHSTLTSVYRNFEKGTSFIFSWFHSTNLTSEISNSKFTKDFDYITKRYESQRQSLDNVYLKFDKFFDKKKITLSIRNSLSWFSFPFEVEGRFVGNRSFNYNSLISVRSTLLKKVQISEGISYDYNRDISSKQFTFQINPFVDITWSWKNSFYLASKLNYFYSNYAVDRRDYLFGDLLFGYTLKPSKLDLKFSIINLFNTKNIFLGYRNAALTQALISKTLERFSLLELTYRF